MATCVCGGGRRKRGGDEERAKKKGYTPEVSRRVSDGQQHSRSGPHVYRGGGGMIEDAGNYTFPSKDRRFNYLQNEFEGEKHAVCKILLLSPWKDIRGKCAEL